MNNESYEKYLAELQAQLKKAEEDFLEAKKSAIKELETMDPWKATFYGAAYSTKIDQVTKAGAEINKISELIGIAEFFKNH